MRGTRSVLLGALVALGLLLAACGQQVAGTPDGFVTLSVGLDNSLEAAQITPAGAPYEPVAGGIAVDNVQVEVSDKDGATVQFVFDGTTYTATPGGAETFIRLTPANESAKVQLPAAGNPYTFESKGYDAPSSGSVIAYDAQDRNVLEASTVLVTLESVLDETNAAVLVPRFPTNYAMPGSVLDLMLVVMANGNASFPDGYLQVPLSDFDVSFGTVVGGTNIGSSKRGIRIEVSSTCTAVTVNGEVTGLTESGSDYVVASIGFQGDGSYEIACPAPFEGDITVDLTAPTVSMQYQSNINRVYGNASDDMAIASVEVFDGPILVATTSTGDVGGDVAQVIFAPGTDNWHADLKVAPTGELTVIATDTSGNESSQDVAFPGFVYVWSDYTGTYSDGSEDRPFKTVAEGLSEVTAGGTVFVREGSYTASGYDITKPLTLVGEGEDKVTLSTTATGSYGIAVKADDVTLSGFTLQGPAGGGAGNYGIKAFKDDNGMTGLTINDVTVTNFGRTEIDLNTVHGAVLSNVTAIGNDTKGVGIALSGVNDVILRGVHTESNLWGSVGLYTTNSGTINGVFDVDIDSTSTFADNGDGVGRTVYIDNEFNHPIGGLRLEGFQYAVFAPEQRGVAGCPDDDMPGRGDDFIDFTKTVDAAVDLALTLCAATGDSAYIRGLGTDPSGAITYENEFHVGDGMSVQTAIDTAASEAVIHLEAGANFIAEGRLEANKFRLVIDGSGATAQSIEVTADEVTIDDLDFEHNSHLVWVDDASDLTLRDVDIHYTGGPLGGIGIYFVNREGDADASGFRMYDGSVAGPDIGISLEHMSGNNSGVDGVTSPIVFNDVIIDGTTFSDLTDKAIYLEALSNATIRNVTISDAGNYGNDSGGFGSAIDINLKYADYANIALDNVSVENSGRSEGDDGTPDPSGAAVTIKARDDGPYSSPAATLDGVTITNSTIIGGSVGLRLGEISKVNGSPANVVVSGTVINGGTTPVPGYYAVMNFTDEDVVITGSTITGDIMDHDVEANLGDVAINP